MHVTKWLGGLVRVRVESADPAQLLCALNRAGIGLYDVASIDDFLLELTIGHSDLSRADTIVNKRGERLVVHCRNGAPYIVQKVFPRYILAVGILILMILSVYLPTRILFVCVEGNHYVPERQILELASAAGVEFGALRSSVRSERVKNTLLEGIPQLQWAGVNTRGCVAVIAVSERDPGHEEIAEGPVSHVVANRDGVICSLTVSQGTPLCQVGQAVQKGQLLVSGYTDCGIALIAKRAEAEIYAQTDRKIVAVKLTGGVQKGSVLRQAQKYRIILGKKQINLWKDSGIYDATCVKMYKEIYLTLPGGFTLPIGIGVESCASYDTSAADDAESMDSTFLEHWLDSYLLSHMIGGRIIGKKISVTHEDGVQILSANYDCIEMIGSSRDEEFINGYGKNN